MMFIRSIRKSYGGKLHVFIEETANRNLTESIQSEQMKVNKKIRNMSGALTDCGKIVWEEYRILSFEDAMEWGDLSFYQTATWRSMSESFHLFMCDHCKKRNEEEIYSLAVDFKNTRRWKDMQSKKEKLGYRFY